MPKNHSNYYFLFVLHISPVLHARKNKIDSPTKTDCFKLFFCSIQNNLVKNFLQFLKGNQSWSHLQLCDLVSPDGHGVLRGHHDLGGHVGEVPLPALVPRHLEVDPGRGLLLAELGVGRAGPGIGRGEKVSISCMLQRLTSFFFLLSKKWLWPPFSKLTERRTYSVIHNYK